MPGAMRVPEDKIDEVTMMFKMFDRDGDGKVTTTELKRVLQALDPGMWTESKVDMVLDAYDTSRDGELQLTEFWGWICGHGGRNVDGFKPALMEKALAEDEERRRTNDEKAAKAAAARAAREAKEAELARKQREREEGKRLSREAFIRQQVSAGVSEEVARKMVAEADADHDGEVDAKEWQWVANENSATMQQIRNLYQKGAGNVDAKGNLIVKEVTSSGMAAIVEAFSSWDKDGSGSISFDELLVVLRTLNPMLGEKTAEAMRKDIDVNQDGQIDIMEFVGWLSGEHSKKKKMKKKAQEEQAAMVALAMHKKRAGEARKMKLQTEFETAQHAALEAYVRKKKLNASCNTLMPGPGAPQMCKGCFDRHIWVCHGCGFVSYFEDCVNGCSSLEVGWTCLSSKCLKKKCGCKKSASFWQKSGCTSDINRLSLDVRRIVGGEKEGTDATSGEVSASDVAA